jgi:hypothetical protein
MRYVSTYQRTSASGRRSCASLTGRKSCVTTLPKCNESIDAARCARRTIASPWPKCIISRAAVAVVLMSGPIFWLCVLVAIVRFNLR